VTNPSTLTIAKASPSVNWAPPADIVYGTALSASQVNATASVPGTFSYSPALGTVLGAGSRALSVTFAPDDAANYSGAEATVTLNVGKAAPTIMWPFLEAIVYGTPLGPDQLNAAADVPGTFSYSYGPTVFLGAGLHFISVTSLRLMPPITQRVRDQIANVNQAPLTITTNSMTKPMARRRALLGERSRPVNFDTLASLAAR
jgi:hypothetical protein